LRVGQSILDASREPSMRPGWPGPTGSAVRSHSRRQGGCSSEHAAPGPRLTLARMRLPRSTRVGFRGRFDGRTGSPGSPCERGNRGPQSLVGPLRWCRGAAPGEWGRSAARPGRRGRRRPKGTTPAMAGAFGSGAAARRQSGEGGIARASGSDPDFDGASGSSSAFDPGASRCRAPVSGAEDEALGTVGPRREPWDRPTQKKGVSGHSG
jgi:hypothetical protein